MLPQYENKKSDFLIYEHVTRHKPPHIHKGFECLLVTEGELELGIAEEYYHMERGDFAIIFPGMVHHYQVFGSGENRSLVLIAEPSFSGSLIDTVERFCPENPVITASRVHPDILYAMQRLQDDQSRRNGESNANEDLLRTAFVQIIFGRSMPCFHLIPQTEIGSEDLIFRTVSYVAKHYMDELSLTGVARELGVSQFTLSRVFSGTFHTHFSQYVNYARLDHAVTELKYSDKSITDICYDSGFESQRTFNRVFRERYRMTPREYRSQLLPTVEEEKAQEDHN
ncbi:MAG: AraC family transcriptional regulator [Lachnospiraceae bacterium]|nr:AraC family transcriptional regulator [Lachnospiraceae bacterium]